MNNLKLLGLLLITLIIGAITGYYLSPTKIEEKIVEKQVVVTKVEKQFITRKVTKPDGTIIEETKNIEKETNKSKTEKSREKLAERSIPGNNINVLAMYNSGSLVYGAQLQKRVIGPISIGLFGFMDGKVGASLGVSF